MTLSNYQFSFLGLTFGAGTPYIVENVDGLIGSAAVRNQDDDRGYIDGMVSGRDFYSGRTVTFDILIVGDSSNNAQYYYKQLQTALTPQTLGYYPDPALSLQPQGTLGLFQFQLVADSYTGDSSVTGLRRMWGRVRLVTTTIDPDYAYGYISTQVEFFFPDPRYYDDTAKTATGTTAVAVSNNGWATTCLLITIATPSASGSITDNVFGYVMAFSNVNTAQSLNIDVLRRTITQGGTSTVAGTPARNTLTTVNHWLDVPGSFNTNLTSTIGSMTITYRNAYL